MFTKQELKDFKKLFSGLIDKQVNAQKELLKPLTHKEFLNKMKNDYEKQKWQTEINLEALKRLSPINTGIEPKKEQVELMLKEINQNLIVLEEKLK
jgi:hypothetical protein